MPKYVKPPNDEDVTAYLRMLYLKTEQRLINEIKRKRAMGYVDYAEVAALDRVQRILQEMVDDSWSYIPVMIEKIFYKTEKAAKGYANAASLTIVQTDVVQRLSNNLLGEIIEASASAQKSIEELFVIARQENDILRKAALETVSESKAAGYGARSAKKSMGRILQEEGITAFTDKRGRKWSLPDYCNMATRTTARQAEVSAILTMDPEHDLYKIVKIGTTCPLCAPLEGRVYSRSGLNMDYPSLAKAFGKVDPNGGEDLSNTYLNIHPNCLHSLVKYTTIGKTEEQIQKDKDFSDFKKNPITTDPRTKKQIAAYKEKIRNRQKLLNDYKQYGQYKTIYRGQFPKTFEEFRSMKYNEIERWEQYKTDKQEQLNKLDFSQMDRLRGNLGNKEVRLWYKAKDEMIPDLIDKSKSLKEQALQAFELRNMHRTQARELMKDQAARAELDKQHKNPTFEEILEHKKKKYGLTDEEAYQDIVRSSATTNKKYDKIAGVDRGEEKP